MPENRYTLRKLMNLMYSLKNSSRCYLTGLRLIARGHRRRMIDTTTKKSRRGPSTAKVTLKLNQISRGLDREDQQYLHFTMRPKGGATDDIIDFGNPSGISKINNISESIDLGDVIKISQNIPRNFLGEQKSVQETRKMRKRFVSIKTKDNQKILFLARTGKDASLISSGLKLISEQRLRRRHGMN
mmetsp:Transcript_7788/g.11145  ORF Transcript_7788/g.11145 Transcript_7788/m.11145 type:complete len:186 (-) Transcript_7788:97-654(-)